MKVVRSWIIGVMAYNEQVPQLLPLLSEPLGTYMGERWKELYGLGFKFSSRGDFNNNLVIGNGG